MRRLLDAVVAFLVRVKSRVAAFAIAIVATLRAAVEGVFALEPVRHTLSVLHGVGHYLFLALAVAYVVVFFVLVALWVFLAGRLLRSSP